jgi:hypothetical protein
MLAAPLLGVVQLSIVIAAQVYDDAHLRHRVIP